MNADDFVGLLGPMLTMSLLDRCPFMNNKQ